MTNYNNLAKQIDKQINIRQIGKYVKIFKLGVFDNQQIWNFEK